jgi:hypothetical protein
MWSRNIDGWTGSICRGLMSARQAVLILGSTFVTQVITRPDTVASWMTLARGTSTVLMISLGLLRSISTGSVLLRLLAVLNTRSHHRVLEPIRRLRHTQPMTIWSQMYASTWLIGQVLRPTLMQSLSWLINLDTLRCSSWLQRTTTWWTFTRNRSFKIDSTWSKTSFQFI